MGTAKILVVGAGGREHAIAWRCRREGHEVLVAPGSPGIAAEARCLAIPVSEHVALCRAAGERGVELAIVGPEQPLCEGLGDRLRAAGIPTIGPSARAAELEASKAAAKAFMQAHAIPTAHHRVVRSVDEGVAAVDAFDAPPVVKADGLAAGKGVTVADSFDQARAAIRECLEGARFGQAGATVVLEQRLVGQEVSLFALTDGTRAATFIPCQDHKRIGDGDTGPNTGGMGAYAPAAVYTRGVHEATMARIVEPTLAGLRAEGRPFVGVLFFGLMVDDAGDPWVIEYNCRFGDPEAQPLMFGLDEPLVPHLQAAAHGTLVGGALSGRPAASVVMASAGYPAASRKGDVITGLDEAAALPDVQVFHAGTRRGERGRWETAGGRVLGVCARADTLRAALARAYDAADRIRFRGQQMRRDIGARVL